MPESWSRLTNLRQLRLTNSVISGSLPSAWGTGMTQIEQLHIVGMDLLSGSWPGGWASGMPLLTDLHLENLPSLALPNTSMTAWIINPAVSHIVIRAVPGMTGIALPPTLPTAYPNITNLVMSKLGLIGSIPSEWNSASWKGRLRLLDLRGNFLNGTLPEWLASVMGDDAILDLSSNNLTGTRFCYLTPGLVDQGRGTSADHTLFKNQPGPIRAYWHRMQLLLCCPCAAA